MFIPRQISSTIDEMASFFPIISLAGPRQSGKSTLLREKFPNHFYINLEEKDLRQTAEQDPVSFLRGNDRPLFIDEIQLVPELFNQLQVEADRLNEPGHFVISGSQNYAFMKSIKQSLAGRVGLMTLLPLSFCELTRANRLDGLSPLEYALKGGYPRTYDKSIRMEFYFQTYLDTYVMQDVEEVLGIRNSRDFRRFLTICASRVGGLINYSSMARSTDISLATAKEWLSILGASYITFDLYPYASNLEKRVRKTPKLYFSDTGLLCHLSGIHNFEQFLAHPSRGEIFENMVVLELYKHYLNQGISPDLYYYRDDNKAEIDLIDLRDPQNPELFEIKSKRVISQKDMRHLSTIGEDMGVLPSMRHVIYLGEMTYMTDRAEILAFADWIDRLSH